MSERREIEELMRRTRRYWYEDGLWEIAVGGFFLLLALLWYAQARTPQGSPLWAIYAFAPVLLIVLVHTLGMRLIEWVRSRHVWPRTGYVKPSRRAYWPLSRVIGLVVAALLALGFIAPSIAEGKWLPALWGLGFALVLVVGARFLGLRRWYALGAWALLTGLGAFLLPFPWIASGALFWLALGLGWLICGLYALRRYRRSLAGLPRGGNANEPGV